MDVLGTFLGGLAGQLGQIFYTIVLPILLLAGIGWLIQRRLGLEMATLRRLNFYFVMPAMVYYAVVTSSLTAGDVGKVVAFGVACLCLQAGLTLSVARLRGVAPDLRRAMLMTTMMHNSGNYGLPLQDLAFSRSGRSDDALGLQAIVMLTQNFFSFTVGVLIAAGGGNGRQWKRNLIHVVKFPPIYALAAALATIQVRRALGADASAVFNAVRPAWEVVLIVKSAFIGVALLTLGAQLALVSREKHAYPVNWSVILRLLGGPAIGLGVILAARLVGIPFSPLAAQVLLISTATPTAVNCMLLCLEFDNHPDYAARAVFYSTLLSPVTVTLTIFLAQGRFLPGF